MALADLDYLTSILELMGLPWDARIILHCGGGYDDKGRSMNRLEKRYLNLPDRIRRRIAFEIDEFVCGAGILEFCKRVGVPAVFDVFTMRSTIVCKASATERSSKLSSPNLCRPEGR